MLCQIGEVGVGVQVGFQIHALKVGVHSHISRSVLSELRTGNGAYSRTTRGPLERYPVLTDSDDFTRGQAMFLLHELHFELESRAVARHVLQRGEVFIQHFALIILQVT